MKVQVKLEKIKQMQEGFVSLCSAELMNLQAQNPHTDSKHLRLPTWLQ